MFHEIIVHSLNAKIKAYAGVEQMKTKSRSNKLHVEIQKLMELKK